MARGAGDPSAKRAKVDEAEEEEDPLVRRKEEVVRLLERARKGKSNARAKEELLTLCARLEAKNEKLLRRLPPELWQKILDENVQQNDLLALAMTCRFFREKQKDLGKKLVTDVNTYYLLRLRENEKMASHSLGWFRWVCDTWEILPGHKCDGEERVRGAVYEGDLVNYAVFQGSLEILRWLVEEKGWETNWETGWWLGLGGSVEILEYWREKGYDLDTWACTGAARAGRLEALKFLRGLDPPCSWNSTTCNYAAQGGHLEVLKWLRDQDPPCPWDWTTSSHAAEGGRLEVLKWLRAQEPPCHWDWMTFSYAAKGGHLDVLKWARSQDPPCPWNERTCGGAAGGGRLDVLKWARSQDPPCPWDEWTCFDAAGGGHLEVLKWARSQDPPCPWSVMTCAGAAEGGHLEVLKWARSQDPPCPWSGETCNGAAGNGHLDVLKWARSQDPPCPWSRDACRRLALEGDHQHIIKWIDQREVESNVE